MITRRRFFQRATRVAGAAIAFSVPVEVLDALPVGHIAAALPAETGDQVPGFSLIDIVASYARKYPGLAITRSEDESSMNIENERGMLSVLEGPNTMVLIIIKDYEEETHRTFAEIACAGGIAILANEVAA